MRILALCLLLAGCAASDEHARCTVPVMRDAGMGVMVWDCANWEIGGKK